MTQKEKKQVRYNLAMSNPIIKEAIKAERGYFQLQYTTKAIIDDYAEIFCIKSKEISRARKLWYELMETHENQPF